MAVPYEEICLNDRCFAIGDLNTAGRPPISIGIVPTLRRETHGNDPKVILMEKRDMSYKIRRLTPLECWRLMGFSDSDYHKAASVVSETQLYKQAGNSIVENVLVAIFSQLHIQNIVAWNDMSEESRQSIIDRLFERRYVGGTA